MKKVFNFTVEKEIETEEKQTVVENGEEIVKTKKVKKQVPQKFFLAAPTRSLRDKAELYYGSKYSEAIKEGLLPVALLSKHINAITDSITPEKILEEQEEEYRKIFQELSKKEEEYQELLLDKKEKSKNKEWAVQHDKVVDELRILRQKLNKLQLEQTSSLNNSAEVFARNKLMFWWMLHIAYAETEDNKFELYFGDGSLEKKLKKYDEYIDGEDKFVNKVLERFVLYSTVWFLGGNSENFDELIKEYQLEEVFRGDVIEEQTKK